jgi:hypothetical protein
MEEEILPAPLEDIPWQGGDKVMSQGGLPPNCFRKKATYSSCRSQISPSNTLVPGKLARNKAARDGTISQAAKTGIPAPHSTPTSPKPPPEKIDPATKQGVFCETRFFINPSEVTNFWFQSNPLRKIGLTCLSF